MKVLVLIGGNNREREVSLRSSEGVINALNSLGHEVTTLDTKNGYRNLENATKGIDAAFIIIHGKGAEDGEPQSELDKLNIKYLGANAAVSRLCFDKAAFKKAVEEIDVRVPRGQVVDKDEFLKSDLLKKPYILKPIDDGSSVDVFIVREPEQQAPPIEIFKQRPQMLLEELIEGAEITVPILGNSALPVIEIIPPEGGEFDYDNKYNGATQEICPPKTVSQEKQLEAQRIAERIHNQLGVRHLSRADMILDKNGKLFVLELNTIPGLTPQSLYPKAAKAADLTFEQLVAKFLEMALK